MLLADYFPCKNSEGVVLLHYNIRVLLSSAYFQCKVNEGAILSEYLIILIYHVKLSNEWFYLDT